MSPKWLLISRGDLDLDLKMCCTPKSHDWSEHFPTQNDVIVWYTPFSDPIWSRNHFQFSHKITITPMTYLFQVYPFPHLTPSSPSRPHLKLRSRFVVASGAHKGLERSRVFRSLGGATVVTKIAGIAGWFLPLHSGYVKIAIENGHL